MKLDKYQILKNDRIELTSMAEANAVFIHTLMTSPDWLEFIGDRKIYSILDAIEAIFNFSDISAKGIIKIGAYILKGLFIKDDVPSLNNKYLLTITLLLMDQ
jgi:hypothetical protein